MPLIELSTALVAAGSSVVVPFVNKVLEKYAQRLGGPVDEQLAAFFTRAHDLLTPTGREAQAVEPKLLLPMMQGASLETDPALAELWAALLANAADPAQQVGVQVFYADILRQLSCQDALLLRALYYRNPTAPQPKDGSMMVKEFDRLTGLTNQEVRLSLDNLLRLRLLADMPGQRAGASFAGFSVTPSNVAGTTLGLGFMHAVAPPTPLPVPVS